LPIGSHHDFFFRWIASNESEKKTGSIGIYGIRFDFSGVAARYGVNFGHVATSEMAFQNSPFYPATKQMHVNATRQVDQGYQRFKEVVMSGRSLSDEKYLETIAQGRVWTGEQAHRNGLVDEIGGLSRAIAFAQRNYTTHGNAQVVTYADNDYLQRLYKFVSKSLQLWTSETTAWGNHDSATSGSKQLPPLLPAGKLFLPTKGFDIFLTTDESAAIQSLLAMNLDEKR
jgi:ClpP class serine protease